MHRSPVTQLTATMNERVRLWKEDYPHFASDPAGMVEKLLPLKPLVGGEVIASWQALAAQGDIEALFESVMVRHYDPCYARSTRRNYGDDGARRELSLRGLGPELLADVVRSLVAGEGASHARSPGAASR